MKLGNIKLMVIGDMTPQKLSEEEWTVSQLKRGALALGCEINDLVTCGAYLYKHDDFVCPEINGIVRAFDPVYEKTFYREVNQ